VENRGRRHLRPGGSRTCGNRRAGTSARAGCALRGTFRHAAITSWTWRRRQRIGSHGIFHHGNFLDLPFEEDFFDCTVSLHTIYHIDGDRQADAVRKLLRVTRPGRPVIIVYSNPRALYDRVMATLRRSRRRKPVLYFAAHPLEWWDQFRDAADVKLVPWRSFSAPLEKKLIPDNFVGRILFRILFELEDVFPRLFVRYAQYPMIVLTKRSEARTSP
jgi:SAM-dependent methyltransferase